MNRAVFALVALAAVLSVATRVSTQAPAAALSPGKHVPPRGSWETRKPSEVGMDDAMVAAAIEQIKTRETNWGQTDYAADQLRTFGRPLGPVPSTRGATNGLVIKNGYVIARFGDTKTIEPTYSVGKSYLSAMLGLTLDRGMIKNITDPVANYVKDGGYDSPHNAKITWENHARQTSEWEGVLFDKPSTFIGHDEFGSGEMKPRAINEPGTYYEYNDVRVNRLSMSLMRLWKRSMGDVLKTEIMDAVGATDTWKWLGYENSDVNVDGKMLRSVPGGTRWGGGLWITAEDDARYGLLMARKGNWGGRQILSEAWVKRATTPGGVANSPAYGYLWWLNSAPAAGGGGRARGGAPVLPKPTTSFEARGNGGNTIYIDPEHDLVAVVRWSNPGDFFARLSAAVK